MNPRLFALLAVLLLAGVGTAALLGSGDGSPEPAISEPALRSTTTTSSTVPAGAGPGSPTTTVTAAPTPTTTTTTTPPPVELTIEVGPVDAELTVTDAAGTVVTGPAPLAATVVLPATVTAGAEGHEPLSHAIETAEDGDTVTVWLDPAGQLVHKLWAAETGRAPKQVAFTPDGSQLWVTLLGGPGIEVFDARTGTRLAGIDLPDGGAVEVIFDEAGRRAFASQMETASVYEIDVATREVVRKLDTGSSWTKVVALSPDESRLYASNWLGNDVSEIDLASGAVLRRIPVVTTPRGLWIDPTGSVLVVAGYDDGELEVVNLATGGGEVLHESGGSMRHLVGHGSTVYASDMGRARVMALDLPTGEVTMLAPTDRAPNTIDLSPDGRVLFVSNRGRNNPESYYLPGPEWGSILLIDTSTGAYLDAIIGGNQPTGLDVSPDGTMLAYTDFLDDRLTVYAVPPTEALLAGGGGRWEAHLEEIRK